MHWTDTQLLVAPFGRRYRPAPEAGSPVLAAAEGDVPLEELREGRDLHEYLRLIQERRLAEHPETLEAPAPWPAALARLTANAGVHALVQPYGTRGAVIAAISLMDVRLRVNRAIRRRAARRYGLTVDDAPRCGVPGFSFDLLLTALRFGAYLRGKPPQHAWHFWLAVGIVNELEERRSWRQARRTSTGRPVSSD